MKKSGLSAIHVPNHAVRNPYQNNLVDGLRANGVDATVIGRGYTYIFTLTRAARNHDIVHIHWLDSFYQGEGAHEMLLKSILFPFDLLFAYLLSINIVWTVHNIKPHEVKYPRLYATLCHVVARLSTTIIVHGETTVGEIIEAYNLPESVRGKCEVVPHGNYIENYPNQVDQQEARSELGIESGELIYLFVGNIRPYKGVPDLIDAFGQLEGEDSKLLIVGQPYTDKYGQMLQQRVGRDDRIKLVPEFVADKDLQLYFNAADVTVLPFRFVLTSGSVLLSLSFGCPVVVPQLGNVAELSEGTIFYDPECETVLHGLVRAQEANLNQLGADALKFAERNDWNSIGKQTAEIYKSCSPRF